MGLQMEIIVEWFCAKVFFKHEDLIFIINLLAS